MIRSLVPYEPLVLFDGYCHLCSGIVRFVLRFNKKGDIKFTPMQSAVGNKIVQSFGVVSQNADTFFYLNNGSLYTHSTAALCLLRDMGGLWKVFYFFRFIPIVWRDAIYNALAKRRYRIFGQSETCMIPDAAYKSRFL
jgi:predicted DCC family thiol-disulfide oxidoreductase YuxK